MSPHHPHRGRTWLKRGVVLLVLLGVGALLWSLSGEETTRTRQRTMLSAILPVTPPPPPTPPPQQQPKPEPEPQKPTAIPPPKPSAAPKPAEAPKPAPSPPAGNRMTMDAPAQAGGDSFDIAAGSGGGGMGSGTAGGTGAGTGFFEGTYGRYLTAVMKQALEADPRTANFRGQLRFSLWLDAAGRITRVQLADSSGTADMDEALVAVLTKVTLDQPPPASMRFPRTVMLTGRAVGG